MALLILFLIFVSCHSILEEHHFAANENVLDISSIHIQLDCLTNRCCFDVSIIFNVGIKRYKTSNMKINCPGMESTSKPLSIVSEMPLQKMNENKAIFYTRQVNHNISIEVFFQTVEMSAEKSPTLPKINISEIEIHSNPYFSNYLLYNIPKDAENMALALLISYQMLFDKNANETEQNEHIEILRDAIVYVLGLSGYGEEYGNCFVEETPNQIIYNRPGDIVVKYGLLFDEKDKNKIMNLTNSLFYEYACNKYCKDAVVAVLNDEMALYYLRKEEISIWDSMKGTVAATIFIIAVVCAVTIAAVCFHCKRRREHFETTLPKSKLHRKRVDEILRRKALKKKKRSVIAKYKALRGNNMDSENNSCDVVVGATEPYNTNGSGVQIEMATFNQKDHTHNSDD